MCCGVLCWALAQYADAVDILKIMKLASLSPTVETREYYMVSRRRADAAFDCGKGL